MDFKEKLLDVQRNLRKIGFDQTNPHFNSKFVSLQKLNEMLLPALNERGLVLLQVLEGPRLVSIILDTESGEECRSEWPLDADLPAQKFAASITYARRIAPMAMLGIVGDEDDDGNLANDWTSWCRSVTEKVRKAPSLGDLGALEDSLKSELQDLEKANATYREALRQRFAVRRKELMNG